MKSLSFGVFDMMNPSNGMPTWTHPNGRADKYTDVGYWVMVSEMLEEAGFDFLFFADTYGYPTIDGELPDQVAASGIQFPAVDPMLIIAALAQVTTTLGFVVTSPTTVEKPYASARRYASLDHYTDGRIGWNIVTGSSQSTVDPLFGVTEQTTHDSRYDIGDEFVDISLALWEGGWDDDALVMDRERGVLVDPARLHRTEYTGEFLRTSGYFAVPPSRQRSPVLFQAGTSTRGRAFAARNAEVVLIQGQTIEKAAAHVTEIRDLAESHGRRRDDIKIITGVTVVVASTSHEAAARRAELEALYVVDDAAVIYAGFTGVDYRGVDPSTPLAVATSDQGQTLVDRFAAPGDRVPTVGDVLESFRLKANRGFQVTGDPIEVAEQLIAIVEGSDVDGFMIEPTFGDEQAYNEFIVHVLPILAERGYVSPRTEGLTLRERLFEEGRSRLPDTHPGARFRHVLAPTVPEDRTTTTMTSSDHSNSRENQ
ncbi:NtaA/DmoA family FMN-dependent monooxygenase [Subtercola frigoramans]|uniref:FMN-dependent oxidoreductase (Nitrilotriacetate monooxygenase family) n=1 Tax=Subtercola frigoramans TaxID=120298 RepID=A0ABS2L4W1_9MICO|nr:NtaA/DmoA family FMN-dependent monooxygenase [Subtercola frigoramans]MBM7472136.1 FMN-dependent oxidoreductase (nitrilotriacetate monooxygenase family) [Subtercola frigoramans]